MKKMLALLLAAMMCLALVACGDSSQGGTTPNENNSQTNNEGNGDTTDIVATLDVAYLTGVWVWQEDMSVGNTKLRSFELYEDGTGKILSYEEEALQGVPLSWSIRAEHNAIEIFATTGQTYYRNVYELNGSYLTDLSWSETVAKE